MCVCGDTVFVKGGRGGGDTEGQGQTPTDGFGPQRLVCAHTHTGLSGLHDAWVSGMSVTIKSSVGKAWCQA